jgi:hypothetical protein
MHKDWRNGSGCSCWCGVVWRPIPWGRWQMELFSSSVNWKDLIKESYFLFFYKSKFRL